jgi:IDEAL domain
MKKFNIGDWVYYDGEHYASLEGALGFVENVGYAKCMVHFIKDRKGKKIDFKKNIDFEDLTPASEMFLDEPALKNMIDLALDTDDEEWFMELTELYKQLKNPDRSKYAIVAVKFY